MKAIFLGSIGTLSDTSELQRAAFNDAFAARGLDWHWGRERYRILLQTSGGAARIDAEARAKGMSVDADALHAEKSRRFRDMLADGRAEPRPGLHDLLQQATARGLPVALVTTTARANVDALLDALDLAPADFALVAAREDVDRPKPAPDCYRRACEMLDLPPGDCLAVEDNLGGVRAARDAGLLVRAWPGDNTADHDFGGVPQLTGGLADLLERERAA